MLYVILHITKRVGIKQVVYITFKNPGEMQTAFELLIKKEGETLAKLVYIWNSSCNFKKIKKAQPVPFFVYTRSTLAA